MGMRIDIQHPLHVKPCNTNKVQIQAKSSHGDEDH